MVTGISPIQSRQQIHFFATAAVLLTALENISSYSADATNIIYTIAKTTMSTARAHQYDSYVLRALTSQAQAPEVQDAEPSDEAADAAVWHL